MKTNEVGAILGAGEVQESIEQISIPFMIYLMSKAKTETKFLYKWTRQGDSVSPNPETFVVLSSEPPAFEPSLQYSILYDPTA